MPSAHQTGVCSTKSKFAVLLVIAFSAALPALADVITYDGSLPVGPTFHRPFRNGDSPPFGTAEGDFYYNVQDFAVSVDGVYTMQGIDYEFDQYMILYQGSFDPVNPLVNALVANDDDGFGALSLISHSLDAGTQYYLVTTTFQELTTVLQFRNEIDGPGTITLGDPQGVPEPSTMSLLALGLVALGVFLPRKWLRGVRL